MNKRLVILLLFASSIAAAQSSGGSKGSGNGVGISTVAAAPTGKPAGTLNVMTDGSTGTDCTLGGGANFVLCRYSGSVWGTFSGGTAAAGGGLNTLQFNNAAALGGVAQFTSNGTTTITGSATSILDLHAAGVGGLLLPGALATGIVKVTTATGALTILTAPAGTIVGTTDTQVLTNKDLTGAGNTFPTFNQSTTGSAATWTTPRNLAGNSVNGSADVAFANKFIVQGTVDTGLSGAQFLGALGTGIVKNTTTTGVLSIAVAGDFPTLNQNTSGTAANLSGTPALPSGTTATTQTAGDNTTKIATDAFVIANSSGSLPSGPTSPDGVPSILTSTPSGGVAGGAAYSEPGVGGRAVTGTTATDTIASTDCSPLRVEYVGSVAVAVTLPTATTLAVPKCVFVLTNNLSTNNDLTVTPTTWTVNGGASVLVHNGEIAKFYVDPNSATDWVADVTEQALSAGSNITFTRSATGLSIASTGGGVTSVATTSPITGGTITTTGTIACATCTTSAASLTLNQLLFGAGSQGMAVGDLTGDVTTAGGKATTIAANAVTLAKMATQANATLLSNVSGGSAVPSANALPVTSNALIKTSNTNGALAASLTTDDGTTSTYTGTGGTKSPVFTSTGTTAGFHDYPQGTTSAAVAPCNVATSICEQAPAAVTSYLVTKPGAAGTGVRIGVNASSVITENFSSAFGAVTQSSKTAAVTTFTVCSATANTACGQTGQYRLTYNVWGSGTACATVTAGSMALNFTWTDENAVTHTTINAPMWDQKTAAMTSGAVNFNTALGTEGGSGSFIVSTNGTIIQAATTYTACTSGTGTYNVRITTEQLQ